jgi:hypothetical protein
MSTRMIETAGGASTRPIATLWRLIAREQRLRLGKRGKSDPILQMWFGEFNKPFKPARTAYDWLSREEKEVDAFVAEPLCGFQRRARVALHNIEINDDCVHNDRGGSAGKGSSLGRRACKRPGQSEIAEMPSRRGSVGRSAGYRVPGCARPRARGLSGLQQSTSSQLLLQAKPL